MWFMLPSLVSESPLSEAVSLEVEEASVALTSLSAELPPPSVEELSEESSLW